mgnify:CR=1 FL=1
MAIITLVVYLADKESNGAAARFQVGERSLKIRCAVTIGVGFTLGRVYTLTLLMNLNSRKDLVNSANSGSNSSGEGWRRFKFAPRTKRRGVPNLTFTLPGVTVNHERTVHVEEPITLRNFSSSVSRKPGRERVRH